MDVSVDAFFVEVRDMPELHSKIRRLRNRLLFLQCIDFGVRGLFWGLCIVALYTLFIKLVPLRIPYAYVLTCIMALSVVTSMALALYSRFGLLKAGIVADGVLGYEERLSSAYVLPDETMPMVAQLHRDAEEHAKKVNVAKTFPSGFRKIPTY